MRTPTGAVVTIACAATLAACSSSPQPAPATTTAATENAHTRGVQIVQTIVPGATVPEAEQMMRTTCELVAHDPTATGVLAVRADLVRRGFGNAVQVTALIGASIAGTCPEHLPAIKGI